MSSIKNGPFRFYIEYRVDINSYYIQIYGEAWNEYVVDKTSSVDFNSSKSIVPSGALNWKVYDAAVVKAEVSAEMIASHGGELLWDYFNNNSVVPSYWKAQPTFRQGLETLSNLILLGKVTSSSTSKFASGGPIQKIIPPLSYYLDKSLGFSEWAAEAKKYSQLAHETQKAYCFSEPLKPRFSTESKKLPGADAVVKHPAHNFDDEKCGIYGEIQLWHLIQHLNDFHRMTRDEIADWVETLDIDINFKVDA